MVWLLYRILRHTCQRSFIRKHYVAHFRYSVTSSGAGYVTYTITAHHCAALSLLPVSVHPAQVVHPVLLTSCAYTGILRLHHLIVSTAPAVHFICFWLQPCGIYGMHSHIRTLYYSYTHHICAVACEFLLLSLPPLVVCFILHFQR